MSPARDGDDVDDDGDDDGDDGDDDGDDDDEAITCEVSTDLAPLIGMQWCWQLDEDCAI